MSWALQRHTLSAFVEARSTAARLRLPALPVKGGLKDTADNREGCIYTDRWGALRFCDAFSVSFHPSLFLANRLDTVI